MFKLALSNIRRSKSIMLLCGPTIVNLHAICAVFPPWDLFFSPFESHIHNKNVYDALNKSLGHEWKNDPFSKQYSHIFLSVAPPFSLCSVLQ